MYNNIGGKIKGLSKTVAVLEAVMAVIIGSIMMFADEDMLGAGVLVLAIGCLAAWISSWLLYGFGEIIEKVCSIEENTRNREINPETQTSLNLKRQLEIERLYSQGMITEEEYKKAAHKE